MSIKLTSFTIATGLLGGAALADVPRVAVDIAPIHSLVARVMDGVGSADLIVPPGASPHEYSLRPSQAAALQDAEIVFWVGEDLTPWMDDAISNLAEDATVTSLLRAQETNLMAFREGALFEAHDHDEHDDHEGHVDHDHEDHAAETHAEAEVNDDHDHEVHDHGDHDPHAWLSVQNANSWLNLIAAQLSAADPDNAGAYFANASSAQEEMATLSSEINEILDPVRDGRFIVFHDAYQYFEAEFDLPAAGAISLSDASDPSPARIAEIQALIAEQGIDCVLAEPQFNPGIVEVVLDGTAAATGIIDPLGSTLQPGTELYPQLIRNMAVTLADCL